jgi:hypothetical protein
MSLGLGDPSPLQYDFADYLQERDKVDSDVGARKELLAFRGAAKTYVTTAYAVYRLNRNPEEEKVLVTSATAKFAGAIATFAFQMITNFDWLGHLRPRSDQRQSALAFDVNGARPSKDTHSPRSPYSARSPASAQPSLLGMTLKPPTPQTPKATARSFASVLASSEPSSSQAGISSTSGPPRLSRQSIANWRRRRAMSVASIQSSTPSLTMTSKRMSFAATATGWPPS